MPETSSSAASTSTTANSNNSYGYDVFLNHRGPDVKKTFASHLYRRLLSHGIRAFLDRSELEPGDLLTTQIEDAIRSASVQVAIFSTGYAESTWCLNELVLMRESKSPIIPVFYGVKPSDLRWTKGKVGVYAEALERLKNKTTHEEKPRYYSKTIENWRNVLSDVAEISGLELEACNGDEGELVDKVVEQVLKWVKRPALDVAKYPTGLDDKLNDLENTVLFQLRQSGKPQILGIVGLGGVGKTTLATEFFNRKNSNYTRSCFLFDVRDNKNSLNSLQRELVKSLTGLDKPIVSVHEGIGILKMHISSPNVLVILDDVDDEDQVDALLPGLTTLLHSDSLIVITSRNKDVLKRSGVEESSMYNLTGLTAHHSLELFCLHAFNQPHPRRGFESLVEKFLHACGGLPLSLKVLGALLNGKDTFYWKDQLDKLQRILPKEIKQTLQISYDALDEEDQQVFLDIACFFIGEYRDVAILIWDSGLCGFQNIHNKCLVEVNSAGEIIMHDHLRDLGREIARDPKLPRRLWRGTENDIDDLLQQSSVISVRGIRMVHVSWENNDIFDAFDTNDTIGRMRGLQLLDTEDVLLERILAKVQSPNLKWLHWRNCPYSSMPSLIFMKNLRVLQVEGYDLETLWEDESQVPLPLQLRVLRIYAPLSDIPKSIGQLKYLEQIVISFLDFANVTISFTKLPEEFCQLQSLKVLVLRSCLQMKSLPECFGNLTNLRYIDLFECEELESLPNSFGNLINLQFLSLRCCSNLTISSKTLGNISTLQYIDLLGTNIRELPDAIEEKGDLKVLTVASKEVKGERETSIDNWILPGLQVLDVSATEISEVSFAEGVCFNLRVLYSRSCHNLLEVRKLPNALTQLHFSECDNLKKIENLYGLTKLQFLDISGCKELEELPNIETLASLRHLKASGCVKLKSIRGLGQLTELIYLTVRGCSELEEVEGIEERRSLLVIDDRECPKLQLSAGVTQLYM